MTRVYGLALTIVFTLLFGGSAAMGQDVSFCLLPLPKVVLQAHTSFNAIYQFDVDNAGIPSNIKAVSKQFTKLEDVQSCLANWSIPNAALKHFVVVFEWQHGVGWTRLVVSGPGTKLTVRLSGERCPYHAAASVGTPPEPSQP